jgi:hypothetical protein
MFPRIDGKEMGNANGMGGRRFNDTVKLYNKNRMVSVEP